MANVAVIGAGWAGCSAAVELAKNGHTVHLFEAARTLGGRARQCHSHGLSLDNGQHILLGAYQSTLALLNTLNVRTDTALLRLPLQMCYPPDINGGYGMVRGDINGQDGTHADGMRFIAPRLPAPLHVLVALFNARGLTVDDKMALARFSSTARWMDWHLNTDCSVAELLDRFDQPANVIRLMWQPLCVAALNTPIATASAQVFLTVLKDSLGASRAASDMLIPRCDLSALLPGPATDYITRRGGKVYPGCAVRALMRSPSAIKAAAHATLSASQWVLSTSQGEFHADGIVIATPAKVAAGLLEPLTPEHGIPAFEYEPITTCYLNYPATTRLDRPLYALPDKAEQAHFGQFVFDRGQLDERQAGVLAVVISASQPALSLEQDALARALAQQLATVFRRPELALPLWSQVITEKRATFACTVNLHRPAQQPHQPELTGITLAGDYTASPYPATLEAAVNSGILAVKALINN